MGGIKRAVSETIVVFCHYVHHHPLHFSLELLIVAVHCVCNVSRCTVVKEGAEVCVALSSKEAFESPLPPGTVKPTWGCLSILYNYSRWTKPNPQRNTLIRKLCYGRGNVLRCIINATPVTE
jgi:hypothetical protein